VIFGVATVTILGCHKPHPCKMANFTDKHWVCPTVPQTRRSHVSLLLLGPLCPCDTTILKLGQLITLRWYLSVQVKGRAHVSHFKSKARNDSVQWGKHAENRDRPKVRPLLPKSRVVRAKEEFSKQIRSATPVNIGVRKQNSLRADMGEVLMV